MAGANIFVIYADGHGNVTLSPRHGAGHFEPEHDTTANVTLLEGSGVSQGRMVANVLCSNCESWSGGTTDFTSDSGSWIHASLPGDPLDSIDVDEEIEQHQDHGSFTWDYSSAQGGSDVNPFVAKAGSNGGVSKTPHASSGSNAGESSESEDDDDEAEPSEMMVRAHGTLAAIVFLVLFPSGAIFVRIPSLTRFVWIHAGIQIFTYCCFIAAAGLGIYIATKEHMLMNHHPIIGIVLLAALFFQPFFGLMHHSFYKKKQGRTFISHLHIWEGRLAIILGMINGGLGIKLAGDVKEGYEIAYGVVAGVMGVAYLGTVVYGEMSRRKNSLGTQNGERKQEG